MKCITHHSFTSPADHAPAYAPSTPTARPSCSSMVLRRHSFHVTHSCRHGTLGGQFAVGGLVCHIEVDSRMAVLAALAGRGPRSLRLFLNLHVPVSGPSFNFSTYKYYKIINVARFRLWILYAEGEGTTQPVLVPPHQTCANSFSHQTVHLNPYPQPPINLCATFAPIVSTTTTIAKRNRYDHCNWTLVAPPQRQNPYSL